MELITPSLLAKVATEAVKGVAGWWSSRDHRNILTWNRIMETVAGRVESNMLTVLTDISRTSATKDQQLAIARALQSVEARTAARTIAVSVLVQHTRDLREELIEQFTVILMFGAGVHRELAREVAVVLVRTLKILCEEAATQLKKHDKHALTAIRTQAIAEFDSGRLHTIGEHNKTLASVDPSALVRIARFCEEYLRLVKAKTAELTPAYFESQKRVPIETIYIAPKFDYEVSTGRQGIPLGLADLVQTGYRTVVLGDPGAGKSTLVQRIAHDLAKQALSSGPQTGRVPFTVLMRRYEERKRSRHYSIVDYIESSLQEDFHLEMPAGGVRFLLSTGRALVVFDGLDELLETHRRREIVDAIETFSGSFPTAHIIVTSRQVGYRETPLDNKMFTSLTLMPFDDDDVGTYAESWFSLASDLTATEQTDVAQSFLSESRSIGDIRSNPLMLGLLCNVYRGARSIPRSRAELYELCAVMLFERWDASRGITTKSVLRADAKGALQEVALWILNDHSQAEGIPERKLHRRIAEHWHRRRFENRDEATQEAVNLVASWQGRAWVLTDVGTDARGMRLYRFTHQTFLEYFASIELVRRNPSPKQLWKIIGPRISRGEWDIVAQLSIQILDQHYDSATNTILALLCGDASNASRGVRYNLLSFAARYADVLMPSPKVMRLIVSACVDLAIEGQAAAGAPKADYVEALSRAVIEEFVDNKRGARGISDSDLELFLDEEELIQPLAILISSAPDRATVLDELVKRCEALIFGAVLVPAIYGFLLLASLDELGSVIHEDFSTKEIEEQLAAASAHAFESQQLRTLVGERVGSWSKVDYRAALTAARLRLIGFSDLAAMIPPKLLFHTEASLTHDALEVIRRTPAGMELIRACLRLTSHAEQWGDITEALTTIGQTLKTAKVPYFRLFTLDEDHGLAKDIVKPYFRAVTQSHHSGEHEESSRRTPSILTSDAMFGAALMLGALQETEPWDLIDESEDQLAFVDLGPLQPLEMVFVARNEHGLYFAARAALENSHLDDHQRMILLDWADHKLSFTKPEGSSAPRQRSGTHDEQNERYKPSARSHPQCAEVAQGPEKTNTGPQPGRGA